MRDWSGVRAVVFDVDGVLTDGRLYCGEAGEVFKVFHVRDGVGIKALQSAGIATAILSGRDSPAVSNRARELGMRCCLLGSHDKGEGIRTIADSLGVSLSEILFVGDDLPDIPALRQVGYAICPADADPAVKEVCQRTLESRGGDGVARELAKILLPEWGKP